MNFRQSALVRQPCSHRLCSGFRLGAALEFTDKR
jgi:hypothetical protein